MSPVDRQGGEARHPAGEPGTKSREDFDNLVSKATEARARGESYVPISEGEEARTPSPQPCALCHGHGDVVNPANADPAIKVTDWLAPVGCPRCGQTGKDPNP